MSKSEVEALTLVEQYRLLGQRSDRLHELLAEAQLQIYDGVWSRGTLGLGPGPGMNTWPVAGMNIDNSYRISAFFAIHPEGPVGAREDLDPMIEYFESRGWEYYVEEAPFESGYQVSADTGEGFHVVWLVQTNGQYSLQVMSEMYWGDPDALGREVSMRLRREELLIPDSVPGIRTPFPSWEIPPIYGPDFRGTDGDDAG